MTKTYFIQLLEKFKQSALTAEEQTAFDAAIQNGDFDDILNEDISATLAEPGQHPLWTGSLKATTFQNITAIKNGAAIEKPVMQPAIALRWYAQPWLKYAAVLIVLAGAALYLVNRNTKPATIVAANNEIKQDAAPGSNRATLTLSDGSRLVLDEAQQGTIAREGNAAIVKKANGQVEYLVAKSSSDKIMYNTMTTPRGGQYQLILPDGSKVWLNAASGITYPTVFAGAERSVTITGEVYIEVVKDERKPFKVLLPDRSAIMVLGTSFNVNTYQDEPVVITTLLQGSIRVQNKTGSLLLKPGQQAAGGKSSLQMITGADPEQVIAWKNGRFNFEDAGLETVLRQLSRWYDVEVEYRGLIPDRTFGGAMDRSLQLSQVLKILKRAGVNFQIEGKKLIVMP